MHISTVEQIGANALIGQVFLVRYPVALCMRPSFTYLILMS